MRTFKNLPLPARLAMSKPVFGIAGGYLGHLYAQRYTRRQIESLQNPEGYKQAMLEIHKAQARRNGEELVHVNWTYGLMVGRKLTKRELEAMDESAPLPEGKTIPEGELATSRNSSNGEPRDSRQSNGTPSTPVSQPGTPNRWEEIRKERATAQPTTWDLIRQKHERERLPPSVPTARSPDEQDPNGWGSETPRSAPSSSDVENFDDNTDEPNEQERFDALLEAERRRSAEADGAQLFGDSTWKEAGSSQKRWR
ncbi:hypothetical protein M407DRAFT_132423 [Tulasnella calospora MUT 4182]|uniref:Uncharacterized protein n=1 Tax=Tulasnella calospora MUT 4182 TaxID=1051891 RepID=A0A0C3LHM7_9AGAM|nr:hypothetical protein M407DRAFT_132423 [Tulasnella calospora MUT 4182]